MPRALRVARGGVGAGVASLLAALSHSVAGGDMSWLAIVATTILALPLCTALAGRVGSLWRLSVAVGAAQFLFHWSFAGLGISASAAGSSILGGGAAMPHGAAHSAHHLAAASFVPSAFGADATMWLLHAVAAVLTIGLLHRGERAALALIGLLRRAVPFDAPTAGATSLRPAPRPMVAATAGRLARRLFSPAAITHRGPPCAA